MHPASVREMEKLRTDQKQRKRKQEEDGLHEGDPSKKQVGGRQTTLPLHASGHGIVITQSRVDQLVRDFVIEDLQPFSVVEQPSFVRLITGLQPSKQVLGRKALMTRIDELYQGMKSELVNHLKKPEWVATTTDCWTARNRYLEFSLLSILLSL